MAKRKNQPPLTFEGSFDELMKLLVTGKPNNEMPMQPITTRFSVWNKNGEPILDTTDFNEVKQRISDTEAPLVVAGDDITIDGQSRQILRIDYGIGLKQLHLVIVVADL